MTPRIGCVGLGWIGQRRLASLVRANAAEIVCLADPSTEALDAAATVAPDARRERSLEAMLRSTPDLDGVVVATPSGMHERQALLALAHGCAVFCQKPLARTADEARAIVDEARKRRRLLAVDMSYRHVEAMRHLQRFVADRSAGDLVAVDLTFHNAYGPDKAWYYDPAIAGGGCLLDLGIHLADLVAWLWPGEAATVLASQLFREGLPWHPGDGGVEDHAVCQLALSNGIAVRLTCGWRAPAGADARIAVEVLGRDAGARCRNVNGSFYDFCFETLSRTSVERVVDPGDDWESGAIVDWARQLRGPGDFTDRSVDYVRAHELLDAMYRLPATVNSPARRHA